MARLRPTLDRLEGRALMAFAGSLDPTFGGGTGAYFDPVSPGSNNAGLYDLARTKVAADNSIFAAGPANGATSIGVIHINANGTRDTAFGTGGETDVALPSGSNFIGITQLLIQPGTGDVTLVVSTSTVTEVARLLPSGSLDPSFGTNGVVNLGSNNLGSEASFVDATYQVDGKLVLAGINPVPTSTPGVFTNIVAVARLTTAGALDSTFATNGVARFFDVPSPDLQAGAYQKAIGVVIQPNDQKIVVLSRALDPNNAANPLPYAILDRLNVNGSQDTSLAQSGILASRISGSTSLAIQPDGKLLVAGFQSPLAINVLARVNPDGTADKTLSSAIGSTIVVQPDGHIVLFFPGGFQVSRVNADLTLDATFGQGGLSTLIPPFPSYPTSGIVQPGGRANGVAVGPNNQIVLIGSNATVGIHGSPIPATDLAVVRLAATGTSARPGDYTGDGIADETVYDPSTGTFAVRSSSNGVIITQQLGTAGLGASVPVPGNYYGTGQDDIAVYLTGPGVFAIKDPTGKTPGMVVPFGSAGKSNSIPVPGDFYGTGQDDIAVYLTGPGVFAIKDPTGKTSGRLVPFGSAGPGNSIPVPGDYYGTSQADIAVYLPSQGVWAIQDPTGKTPGKLVPFGKPGLGNSIPVPGDYDGSGKTELAVYLQETARLIYRPANGGPDVTIPFGKPGLGVTLPAPGDYDGSGKTEAAVYVPSLGLFAYRPAKGGADSSTHFFGPAITGAAVPVTAVVPSFFFSSNQAGGPIGPSVAQAPPGWFDFVPTEASTPKKPKA